MKEATGELSMTVVVIIAVIALVVIVQWLMPKVSTYINTTWNNISTRTA